MDVEKIVCVIERLRCPKCRHSPGNWSDTHHNQGSSRQCPVIFHETLQRSVRRSRQVEYVTPPNKCSLRRLGRLAYVIHEISAQMKALLKVLLAYRRFRNRQTLKESHSKQRLLLQWKFSDEKYIAKVMNNYFLMFH